MLVELTIKVLRPLIKRALSVLYLNKIVIIVIERENNS